MDTASCSTLPAAFVTKEMVPNIRLVPRFSRIATPMVIINSTGSNQESVVSMSIRKMMGTASSMICCTSLEVFTGASTEVTAEPSIQFSPPIICLTAGITLSPFASSTVTLNRAFPSLYQSSVIFCSTVSRGS